MKGWHWPSSDIARVVHDEQLAEHGGAAGVRDENALLSALGRPQNLAAYGTPDAADLAASFAFGIARNHPFVDGNKRTAWVMARLFLRMNGYVLRYDDAEAVITVLRLAAGQLGEGELADWFRERLADR